MVKDPNDIINDYINALLSSYFIVNDWDDISMDDRSSISVDVTLGSIAPQN